ncbi:phage holin family protein [Alicyclobacillus dauci]|uniref:Phage holin family protein n=1 Tax=Alicyclobacillus dauci TaxID=1475485 RepID=A0ABY6Z5W2_9BACL|nr:phage holin family protein [Alicyclobacillus dauci]WAH38002.1 phage holin family protein [Alicyclobacillus dauci]
MNWIRTIIRFIVSALVYRFVAFLVPGFAIANFGSALLTAIVVALVGWGVEALLGRRVTRYSRGIVGFIVSVVVLYVAQWIVPGMSVSVGGAIIASIVIGIIDMLLPVEKSGVTPDRH